MYCIMRIEKRKRQDIGGLQRENNRTATEYNNRVEPGMDILNVDLLHSDNWMQDIQQEIDRAGRRATGREQPTENHRKPDTGQIRARADSRQAVGRDEPESAKRVRTDEKANRASKEFSHYSRTATTG